jgi:Queuine tRNA-ribosyltransferases, contain PUA domain
MTEFFEIHDRDGAARVGELRLAESTWTPALADPIIEDSGSLWVGEQESSGGDPTALTVLPHRAFPAGTREEIRDVFSPDSRPADFPAAVVVSSEQFINPDGDVTVELASNSGPQSETGETHPDGGANRADEDEASLNTLIEGAADAFVLSDAAGIVGHGEAFRDAIVRTRNAIPADTALYLSGVATPGNAALLAYAGVDLVDAKRARLKGAQGMYLTTDGQHFLEDLEELPCACEACRKDHQAFDRDDCAAHNIAVLKTELTRVRERIRTGQLRDYLEGQARHEQWITAAMREFDNQWGYLERRTPTFRSENITAATGDTIRRVEIRRSPTESPHGIETGSIIRSY